jgi:hypothetical protein
MIFHEMNLIPKLERKFSPIKLNILLISLRHSAKSIKIIFANLIYPEFTQATQVSLPNGPK